MRTTFINELIAQARLHPEIFLVVGDLGFSVIEPFAAEFPDRYLNAGIAEQNMTGIAAGLASEGYHVFTYSIANFPTTRCLEQIRNDVCYHQLPVTIVSVGGGVAYGNLGYSHHAVQDYALLRCLPGMTILSPGDPKETQATVRGICNDPSPSYLRLGKNGEPVFHNEIPLIPDTNGVILHVAGDRQAPKAFLTTGTALEPTMTAHAQLHSSEWAVYSMPVWSRKSKTIVSQFLRDHEMVVSVEEHLQAGGFGSYLRECTGNSGDLQKRLNNIYLDEMICGMVGSQNELRKVGGMDTEDLLAVAKRNEPQ